MICEQDGAQGLITVNYAYARYGTSAHPVHKLPISRQLGFVTMPAALNSGRSHEVSGTVGSGLADRYGAEQRWTAGNNIGKSLRPALQSLQGFHESCRGGNGRHGLRLALSSISTMMIIPATSETEGWNKQLFNTVGDSVDFYVWHDLLRGRLYIGRRPGVQRADPG